MNLIDVYIEGLGKVDVTTSIIWIRHRPYYQKIVGSTLVSVFFRKEINVSVYDMHDPTV